MRGNKRMKSGKFFHSYFFHILIPFTLLCILAIIITAWFNWKCVGDKYEEKIREARLHQLTQLQLYGDRYIYEDMIQTVTNDFPGGIVGNVNFFSRGLSQYEKYKAYKYLVKTISENDYLYSITLCNPDNTILDSGYGLSETHEHLESYFPYKLYQETAALKKRTTFLTETQYRDTARPYLTMVYNPTPFDQTSDTANYIALSIDQEYFFETMRNMYQFSGELIVLNEADEILFSSLKDLSGSRLMERISPDFDNPEQFCQPFQYEGKDYYMILTKSGTSGWKYISIITADNLNSEYITVRNTTIMIMVIIMAFVFIAVNLVSREIYRPIKQLRNRLLSHSETATNDFAVINSVVSHLEQQADAVEQTLSDNRQILIYKLTSDLLHLHNEEESQLQKRVEMCKIFQDNSGYCILLAAPSPEEYSHFSMEQQEYIAELTKQYLSSVFNQEVLLNTEAYPQNILSVILNLDDSMYQVLLQSQDTLLENLKQQLHCPVNLYISGLTGKLSQLSKLYTQLRTGLQYSFLSGYGNVFTTERIALMEHNVLDVVPKVYTDFESMIRSGQHRNAKDFLDSYENAIMAGGYSYRSVNAFLMHLFNIVFRCCAEMEVFQSQDVKFSLKQQFEEAVDFRKYMDCIRHAADLCYQAYQESVTGEDNKLIERIKEYILSHCGENISLASIAMTFNISSSHLSRLFKSVTGDNFSSFVSQVKLEKAAQLICSHPEQNIIQIEESLGYFTPAYFNKLFKQKYGVTPVQYRKQHTPMP